MNQGELPAGTQGLLQKRQDRGDAHARTDERDGAATGHQRKRAARSIEQQLAAYVHVIVQVVGHHAAWLTFDTNPVRLAVG
ncbi:hypothetical protein D3C72_1501310 [compost metagenome]